MSEWVRALHFLPPHGLDLDEVLDNIQDRIHAPADGFVPPEHAPFLPAESTQSADPPGLYISSSESLRQIFSGANAGTNKGLRGWWHAFRRPLLHSEPSGTDRVDLFMTASATFDPRDEIDWESIQVIGQACFGNATSYQDGLLRLSDLALGVFTCQPTRFYVHGLYIRGSRIEQWLFDRSGLCCWRTLDAASSAEATRLVKTLCTYTSMSGGALGRTHIIESDNDGEFIRANMNVGSNTVSKLYIRHEPVAIHGDQVSAGTTCYLARAPDSNHWSFVVKLKWRRVSDLAEENIFRIVNPKHIPGVVQLHYYNIYEQVSTAHFRQNLFCGSYRQLRGSPGQAYPFFVGSTDSMIHEGGVLDYTDATQEEFVNRTLICLVISPAGRRLKTFRTRLELLTVLRDAVTAHRLLFQEARIIHQDISATNIIIVDDEEDGESRGVLIDLDVALNIDVGPRTSGEVTGTRPFMAIGILKERERRYRHDLESFLYVLLWMIITNREDSPPETSLLRGWSRGTRENSADQKLHYMRQEHFADILSEFPAEFESIKPLAEAIRAILFPVMEDGSIYTGTNSAKVNEIYDRILGAFEQTIAEEQTLQ